VGREADRIEVRKPRGKPELLGSAGRQVPKKLRDSVFEKIIEPSIFCSVVEVLQPNAFPNEQLSRHLLKKLWGQANPLLDKPEAVQDRRLHCLANRDFPLLKILGNVLIDPIADFRESSPSTEVPGDRSTLGSAGSTETTG
jgi:hypothetical protein